MVRSAGGSPVAGARIQLLDPKIARLCPDLFLASGANLWLVAGPNAQKGDKPPGIAAVRTGPDGRFEIATPGADGPGIVVVTADGFAPHLEAVDAGKPKDIVLDAGRDLTIHMLDLPTGKPLEEAEVTLVPLDICGPVVVALREQLVARESGAPDGRVVFRNVADGIYALRLTGMGGIANNVSPFIVGKEDREFRVRMSPGRSVKGRVEFPPHAPHSAGSVLAFWQDREAGPGWLEAPLNGEDSFELSGLPYSQPISLLARTEDGLSSRIISMQELGRTGQSLNAIPLLTSVSWRGRLPDGVSASRLIVQPLLGAAPLPLVPPESLSVPVDPGGYFTVPAVSPVVQTLRVLAPEYGEAEIRLAEAATSELGLVSFRRGRTIQGRALWKDRSPLQGATVELLSDSGPLCGARVTSNGEFACSMPLSSASRNSSYLARVSDAAFRLLPLSDGPKDSLFVTSGFPVEATVSRPAGRGAVESLRLESDEAQIGGEGSRSKEQVILYARAPGGKLSMHLAGVGKVEMAVSNPRGGPWTPLRVDLSVAEGIQRRRLILPQGARVFGSVAAAGSVKPIENAEVELGPGLETENRPRIWRLATTNAEGSWKYQEVPEAIYQIVASAKGFSQAGRKVSVPGDA
ncbi:MAG TPA: hypothetical protein VGR38_09540, partial [Candidatus Polarisedimenticolia bacterium]|nr:hypothetical protein [Candidatus Polarisedimenticolia bacterium]